MHIILPIVNGRRNRVVRRTDEDIFLCVDIRIIRIESLFNLLNNHNIHLYSRGSQNTTRATFDSEAIRFKYISLHLNTATLSHEHRDVHHIVQAATNITTTHKRSGRLRVTTET